MRPTIPLRERWRAQFQSWPADRRGRFERRLGSRRVVSPTEGSDWAFVDTFRTFREELLRSGEISFAEAYDGDAGKASFPEPGDPGWPEYEQKLNAVLSKGRRRPVLANGAQLRLITGCDGSRRWDR